MLVSHEGDQISLMTAVLADDLLRVIPDSIGKREAENGKCCLHRPMTCPIVYRAMWY